MHVWQTDIIRMTNFSNSGKVALGTRLYYDNTFLFIYLFININKDVSRALIFATRKKKTPSFNTQTRYNVDYLTRAVFK